MIVLGIRSLVAGVGGDAQEHFPAAHGQFVEQVGFARQVRDALVERLLAEHLGRRDYRFVLVQEPGRHVRIGMIIVEMADEQHVAGVGNPVEHVIRYGESGAVRRAAVAPQVSAGQVEPEGHLRRAHDEGMIVEFPHCSARADDRSGDVGGRVGRAAVVEGLNHRPSGRRFLMQQVVQKQQRQPPLRWLRQGRRVGLQRRVDQLEGEFSMRSLTFLR